ncbi:MAG: globin [Chloroflexota bacterium]|nr:globin [Dehalococcoidia bacterium]MDW8046525.1 globin [Chloroflexota bacterium]
MALERTASLLELAGGRETIERAVELFYAAVEHDAVLRPIYPDDLRPGREKLKLFFVQWLGGPPLYSQRFGHPRLRRRHFPFVIDEEAAERWLQLMHDALLAAGVPEGPRALIEERLRPLAFHMVNAHEDVPREPLGDVWMD